MSARLALATSASILALLLVGCSSPSPSGGGQGGDGGSEDPADAPVTLDQPAWYGEDRFDDGCPVPVAGVPVERADIDEFLQVGAPDHWCTYKSTDYTQFYVIPVQKGTDFALEVREVLEPVGWKFDPADDDSPEWSWIQQYPPGSEEGFTDGAVDGAVLVLESVTEDDLSRRMWYSRMPTAFGADWEVGDEVQILGFW